jgi:DNA end-binding protein Ku
VKPYRLLLEAMRETNRVAIARVVIRSKEQLVALRPMGDALGMATMIFADEVAPADSLEEIREAKQVATTKRELDMAKQLIGSLAGDFQPEAYTDTYRQEVLDLIEQKAQGKAIAAAPAAEEAPAPAPDLMSALKASLDAVRQGDGARRATGTTGARGKSKKSPATTAAKKAPAKKAPAKKNPAKKPGASRTPA